MSASVEAPAPQQKVRWHNPETHRLEWLTPDELQAKKAAKGDYLNAGKYARLIENLTNDLEKARDSMLRATDPRLRDRDQLRMNQMQLAIDNAQEAELVTDAAVQFGTPERRTFAVRVPPHLEEFDGLFPRTMASHHRYVATDPLEIAWLRRQVREGSIPGLREMPVGMFYAKSKDGSGRGMWLAADAYHEGVRNEVFQP